MAWLETSKGVLYIIIMDDSADVETHPPAKPKK
jgi:hypothetical protein